ncbi:CLUMA_CG003420, isoform A, partial [Clunio marinus]
NCCQDFNNESSDEFTSKLKSTNSSFCLLRHNRNITQPMRGNERSSSGASILPYSYSSSSTSNSIMHEKSTDSTILPLSSGTTSRNKEDISRQKSPIFNRRRASSITLARTIPSFAPNPSSNASQPAHNPNDLYRYIKNDEQQRQNVQSWNETSQSGR